MRDPDLSAMPDYRMKRSDDGRATVSFTVPEDLACFAGHFPDDPLLPGVVMLGWFIEAARAAFEVEIRGVAAAKFTAPVRPGAAIAMELVLKGGGVVAKAGASGSTCANARLLADVKT